MKGRRLPRKTKKEFKKLIRRAEVQLPPYQIKMLKEMVQINRKFGE